LATKNEKMNVYLVRSEEMPIGMFNGVAEYLNHFGGPVKFSYDIEEVPENEEEIFEENVELIKYTIGDYEPKDKEAFNHYFQQCQSFRSEKGNIDSSDLVILLTNQRNENNYFGYCDNFVKNVFIQCSNWNFIFGEEEFNPTLAISYEVIAWTLRSLIFGNIGNLKRYINGTPKGCIMDMCTDKKDISFKMRTGDISPAILELIRNKEIYNVEIMFEQVNNQKRSKTAAFASNEPTESDCVAFRLVESPLASLLAHRIQAASGPLESHRATPLIQRQARQLRVQSSPMSSAR
jgi:hypothetical protein